VLGLRRFRSEICFIVQQKDNTNISLPLWMTESAAAHITIVCEPRLPLAALLDLRHTIDVVLSSLATSAQKGDSSDESATSTTTRSIRDNRESQKPMVGRDTAGNNSAADAADVRGNRGNRKGDQQ